MSKVIQPWLLTALVVLFAGSGKPLLAEEKRQKVASINGEAIYLEDIIRGSEKEIYQAEKALYDLKYANLRQLMVSRLIAADPRSKGLDDNEYLRRFVVKEKTFTDADIDSFIIKNRIPQSKVNATLRQQVRRYLTSQYIANQIDSWVDKQSEKYPIKIYLKPPEEPRFYAKLDGAPVRGGKKARVTIVEYSDFECPFCTRANETLHQLAEIYGDKIRLVYKHLPLISLHENAHNLSLASVCAQQQGETYFWKLHDKIFENNRGLTLGKVKDYVKGMGLNMERFNQCLSAKETLAKVDADMREATGFGFSATPGFLINGRVLEGAQSLEVFQSIIDEELGKK